VDVVPRQSQLLEVGANGLGGNAFLPQRRHGAARGPLRELAPVRPEDQAVVHELGRRCTERLEQAPMEILVGAMVVAAHYMRDPEIDVVDYGSEVIRRRAVLAQQRQTLEAIAERSPHLTVALRTLALAHGPLVPGDPQPLEIAE